MYPTVATKKLPGGDSESVISLVISILRKVTVVSVPSLQDITISYSGFRSLSSVALLYRYIVLPKKTWLNICSNEQQYKEASESFRREDIWKSLQQR